jgi:hypothetical protein
MLVMSTLEQRRKFYEFAHDYDSNVSSIAEHAFKDDKALYAFAVMCNSDMQSIEKMANRHKKEACSKTHNCNLECV